MRPGDIATEEVHAWAKPLLDGRRRVLEVGCGSGELAIRFGADGLDVTALDIELPDSRPASPGVTWVQADFLAFEAEPFDALFFTRSLHHIHPLESAIDRARRLVRPGGLLLVDDFDCAAPDTEAARWYYEIQELLAAAQLYAEDHIHGRPDAEPIERWAHEHDHDPPLHCGTEMLGAIGDRFEHRKTLRGPYLYRSIIARLEVTPRGAAVARHIYTTETRRVHTGTLAAIGLRMAAEAPA